MKKGLICTLVITVLLTSVTGCGNTIPEMNEEQQELVVEYAVSEVLKYDQNHEPKLTDIILDEETEPAGTEAEEPQPSASASPEDVVAMPEQEETNGVVDGAVADAIIDNTGEGENIFSSIEDILNMSDVKFTYTGYEISSFYPKQAEDVYFVMNATSGNSLLVLKFNVENTAGIDTNLDMAGAGVRFKISIDGEEKNALTTMLLNDMSYYQGTIPAGESVELVLVCEIPEQQADKISTLGLTVKNVENTATISLL